MQVYGATPAHAVAPGPMQTSSSGDDMQAQLYENRKKIFYDKVFMEIEAVKKEFHQAGLCMCAELIGFL